MCLKFAGLSDRRHSQDPLLGTRGSQHPIASPQSALNQSSAATYGTQHKLHSRLKPENCHICVQGFDKDD